jgi:hypothetical protein
VFYIYVFVVVEINAPSNRLEMAFGGAFAFWGFRQIYKQTPDQSILNEVVLKEDEMVFLKEQFESDKERIKQSFLEIKRLLNDFDIENL